MSKLGDHSGRDGRKPKTYQQKKVGIAFVGD
jgi:hypothetical protein